jgi:hypothetical protein
MASKYEYRQIKTRNSIRLVELSPALPNDPRLHCNLKHTNLEASKGKFEALSYTWGSLDERETIFCGNGDAELEVTLNCVIALRHLRHTQQTRTVWVDAICIDQDNIAERNTQVRIMGKIFAAAWRVVFLGESTLGSHLLFQELAKADNGFILSMISRHQSQSRRLSTNFDN